MLRAIDQVIVFLAGSLFSPLTQRDSEKLAADVGPGIFVVADTGQKVAALSYLLPASCRAWGRGGGAGLGTEGCARQCKQGHFIFITLMLCSQ